MAVIVPGTANGLLAGRLAEIMGAPLNAPEVRRFPDGEAYVRLDGAIDGDAVVVQSTAPDANLVELLLLQDAAREAGASSVTTVIPYLGYARQDRAFQAGEAVASRATARAIAAGADRVIAVDPHKSGVLEFFECPATEASAVPALARRLAEWGTDAILAPDAGARSRAELAADTIGASWDHLEKTRLGPKEVKIAAKKLNVRGQTVAIVDDMIASGSTMVTAAVHLKRQGATHVFAACTHGLFTGGSRTRILGGGIDRILCADTVEGEAEMVSAAQGVAQALSIVA